MLRIRTERLIIDCCPSQFQIPRLRNKRDVRAFLKQTSVKGSTVPTQQWLTGGTYYFVCIDERQLADIGIVTSTGNANAGTCIFGYSVNAKHRGNGYATEAALAVMDLLVSDTEVKAIVAETLTEWKASIRVMEKIGMIKINADLGPSMVRYAWIREGVEVDLIEGPVLELAPFRHSPAYALRYLLKWQWQRETEWLPLLVFIAIGLGHPTDFWLFVSLTCFVGYGGLLV